MDQNEINYVHEQLKGILGNDNAQRKECEANLKKIQEGEVDKYACYLVHIISLAEISEDVRCLAAVLIRRPITDHGGKEKPGMWGKLNPQAKEMIKTTLLGAIPTVKASHGLLRKTCNLAVEVAGALYELDDHLNLIFQSVNSGDA